MRVQTDSEAHLGMPEFSVKLLELSGLLAPSKRSTKHILSQIMFYCSFLDVLLLMPACIVMAALHPENFPLVTKNLFIFLVTVITFLPSAFFALQRKETLELVDALLRTAEEKRGNPHFDILVNADKRTTFISKLLIVAGSTAAVGWCLLPFLIYCIDSYQAGEEEEAVLHLLYEVWLPFESDSNLVFFLIYTMQSTIVVWGITFNFGIVLLFLTSITYCSARFKILQNTLEEIDVLIPVRDVAGAEDVAVSDSTSPNDVAVSTLDEGVPDERYLIECIKDHQRAISLVGDLNDVYSTVVLMTFFFVEIGIAIMIFLIIETKDDHSERFQFVAVLIATMSELFLICFFAEDIIQQSSAIGKIIYESQWYHRTKKYKQRLPFVILSAQRHKAIKAGCFYELSYERFGMIVNAAYSMFTLLQEIRG